jgi:hypothetical protein
MKKHFLLCIALIVVLANLTGCAYRDYYHHPRHKFKQYPHRNPYGGWYSNHGFSR